jgi:hypothetical protein
MRNSNPTYQLTQLIWISHSGTNNGNTLKTIYYSKTSIIRNLIICQFLLIVMVGGGGQYVWEGKKENHKRSLSHGVWRVIKIAFLSNIDVSVMFISK